MARVCSGTVGPDSTRGGRTTTRRTSRRNNCKLEGSRRPLRNWRRARVVTAIKKVAVTRPGLPSFGGGRSQGAAMASLKDPEVRGRVLYPG